MKSYKIFILFSLLTLALACCSSQRNEQVQNPAKEQPVLNAQKILPFKEGETIKYDIKSFGVKAGEATLKFNGQTKYKGNDTYLITFVARAVNFLDEEKIYADLKTFYPVAVERNLNIWGKKEKITEEYYQEKGMIKITKNNGGRTTEQAIEKKGAIDNIYCFIYRYRKSGSFKIGDSFSIHLPTKDVTIDLVKMAEIKTSGKTYVAYYLQSDPSKYKVWFDTSVRKIPLKINGAVGISDTAMVMAEYQDSQN